MASSNVLRTLRNRELGQRPTPSSSIPGLLTSYPLRSSRLDMFEVACDVMTRLTVHLRFENPPVNGRYGLQYVACGGVFANWLVGDCVTFDELRFYIVYRYGARMNSSGRIRSVLRDIVTEASLRGVEDDYENDNTAKSPRNRIYVLQPLPIHLDGSTICRVRHRCGVHMRFIFSQEGNAARDMIVFPDDREEPVYPSRSASADSSDDDYDDYEKEFTTVITDDSDDTSDETLRQKQQSFAMRMRLVYLTEHAALRHKRVDNFDFLIPGLNNVVFALTSENDTADALTHVCFLRRRHHIIDVYRPLIFSWRDTVKVDLIGKTRIGGRNPITQAPLYAWKQWCVQSRCCCCVPLTSEQIVNQIDRWSSRHCYFQRLNRSTHERQICSMTEHAFPMPSCPIDATRGAARRNNPSPDDEHPQCSCRINQKPNCARYSVLSVRRKLDANEPSRRYLIGDRGIDFIE